MAVTAAPLTTPSVHGNLLSPSRPRPYPHRFTTSPLLPSNSGKEQQVPVSILGGAGFALAAAAAAAAAAACAFPYGASAADIAVPFIPLTLQEPDNALSLPTWAVHVSSVVEWVTAMALVWEYGEKSGFESWKGLSWGMIPLLGGALCACTWHFFYNAESLDVLVALQAVLTVIGNVTMCIAAFRIFKSSQKGSSNP